MKVRYLSCGLAAVLAAVTHLHATMIDLLVDPGHGSAENTGATAFVSLEFSEDEAGELMTISIENTTPAEIGSSLTAVGLELPDSLWLTVHFAPGGESSYFDTLTFNHSVMPVWLDAPGGYDLMITSDGNFEGGNAGGAPTSGEMQVVTLTLGDTGLTLEELLTTFEDYYLDSEANYVIVRFLAVGSDGELSDKVLGGTPEPGSLGLVAWGGLLALRRRPAS